MTVLIISKANLRQYEAEVTVLSEMRVGNRAFFPCFIVVAYWLNRQQLTNEIRDLGIVKKLRSLQYPNLSSH